MLTGPSGTREIKPNITSGGHRARNPPASERWRSRHGDGLEWRVSALTKEGAKVAFTFNQGILQTFALHPQGRTESGDGDQLLNEAVDPVNQANLPLHIVTARRTRRLSIPACQAGACRSTAKRTAERQQQALMSYAWWSSPEGEAAEKRWSPSSE